MLFYWFRKKKKKKSANALKSRLPLCATPAAQLVLATLFAEK